jgi:hypothetical protein
LREIVKATSENLELVGDISKEKKAKIPSGFLG